MLRAPRCTHAPAPDSQARPGPRSRKEKHHQEAEGNEASHDDPIPPPLRPDARHQVINPRHRARRAHNPSINIPQHLALRAHVLAHRIRLAQHPIHGIVAAVEAGALVEHVVGLGGGGVAAGAVRGDVGAHAAQQALAVARRGQGLAQPPPLAPVLGQHLAVPRQRVPLDGRAGQRRVRVERAAEVREHGLALQSGVSCGGEGDGEAGGAWRTCSRISSICASVRVSSSLGWAARVAAEENCE